MKKLLIVVDYQVDFVSGSLGFAKAIDIENQITKKIKMYQENQDDIVFTLDTHEEDYLQSEEGKHLPISHCVAGSEGHQLYGEVRNLAQNYPLFKKITFGSDQLYAYLKQHSYEEIELVGVVTNICVISNAVLAKTAAPNTPIIVDASCCGSGDEELHEKALDVMESFHIKVTNRS